MIAANQIRRSSRIRNNELPPLSSNQKTTHRIVFTQYAYINSFVNDEGVLILSNRKRRPPTADEIGRGKQKCVISKLSKFHLLF